MNTIYDSSIGVTRDVTYKYATSCGDESAAIVSLRHQGAALWKQAIDEMLAWKADSTRFEPEDQPVNEILDSAIDYAMDQIAQDGPVPESIVPSGGGRIAMEWNDGSVTVVVEFVGQGVAIYTRFERGRMMAKEVLRRNPQSRKLEIRG